MGRLEDPNSYIPQGQDLVTPLARTLQYGGEQAAQNAYARGAAQQGMIGGLAGAAMQGVEQYQQEKALSRQDQAFTDAVSSWDGQDPRTLVASLKMFPPDKRAQIAQGIISLHEMTGKADQAEAQRFGHVLLAAGEMSDDMMRRLYPGLVQQSQHLHGPLGMPALPPEWDPKIRPDMVAFGRMLTGEKAPEVKTREVKTRLEGGGERVQIVEDKPGQEFTSAPEPPPSITPYQQEELGLQRKRLALEQQQAARGPARGEHLMEVPGPNGTILQKLVPDEELRQGVQMAPKSTGNKPVTGAERQTLAFYNRAQSAHDSIKAIEDSVAKYGVMDQQRLGYGGVGENYLKSPEMQEYRKDQRQFTEARLRKESGAAIPESEFKNDARMYFAQPGDSPQLIEKKRQDREKVLNGLAYASGRAYEEYYGSPAPTPMNEAKAASPAATAQSQGMVKPVTKAEFEKLPSGALFRAPDGKVYRKD